MSKLTKNQRIDKLVACLRTQGIKMRELETRLSTQEKWTEYADEMLTALNDALPDPEYDAKCEAAVAGVEASLDRHRERLGLNKPQLKQLDQSVFDGVDEKWRFAAVDECGEAYVYTGKPEIDEYGICFIDDDVSECKRTSSDYDATNWKESLIERESKELTGSELCKSMINRGDKIVLCIVRDYEHENDIYYDAITHCSGDYFESTLSSWRYATPINNQGEPLTASEVGL